MMVNIRTAIAAVAVAVSPLVYGQTFSSCNPMQRTDCSPNPGLNSATYTVDFTQGMPSQWKMSSGKATTGADGALFAITEIIEAPTMQSNFFIFFGFVEVVARAAPGQGIVSSFILQSDTLDEIDWEMIGSQTNQVQSNYFGKGNTTTYDRGKMHPAQTPSQTWHRYAIDWTETSITWLIDGVVVRVVTITEAVNFPQTPMNIRLGNWVAGQPKNAPGTVQWAGGMADMSKAPFNMNVKSVTVKNYNPAMSYAYMDKSGNKGSIKKITDPAPSLALTSLLAATASKTSTTSMKAMSTSKMVTSMTSKMTTSSVARTTAVAAVSTSAMNVIPPKQSSTVTINVAGATGVNAVATSKPAMVTTNAAPTQSRHSLVALAVVLALSILTW